MFFAALCVACGRPGERLCAPCAGRLEPARPFDPPPELDACVALLAYDGTARDLIVALKYRNGRWLAQRSGTALGVLVGDEVGTGSPSGSRPIDLVTWAPTGRRRRRARGYDQAELVARQVGRALHLPTRRLLERQAGAPQTGRSRAERLSGPSFSPTRAGCRAGGAAILVVDDVLTTGATLSAAARALRPFAPRWVGGAVLAHTELGSGRSPAARPGPPVRDDHAA